MHGTKNEDEGQMTEQQDALLEQLLQVLWGEYLGRVPYAQRYVDLVEQKGGRVVNDHIAFRSLNTANPAQPAGREALVSLFQALGYRQAADYDFPATNLSAVHLEHADDSLPKLFISQLEVDRLPAEYRELIRDNVARVDPSFPVFSEAIEPVDSVLRGDTEVPVAAQALARLFRRPWDPPDRSAVLKLSEVSQYGAWTLLHGNSVNHFTTLINAHGVPEWPDIQSTVEGLRSAGVPMKDAIEGEPGSHLRQSATQAAKGRFPVTETDGSMGEIEWTYAYYELAQRGLITTPSGETRQFSGFLGPQTTGLFALTDTDR
jgi:hypothetical protein